MADSAPLASVAEHRLWLRRAAWVAIGLVLCWIVAWLAVPPLLKWQLQKQAGEALGRVVTVEAVDFKPWSLELTVTGLRVATADGQGEQFSLRSLYMNAELQSLVRLAPVLDALRLDGPRLSLRRLGGDRLDVDDIVQRLSAAPREPEPEDAAPARFALFNLELVDGGVTLVDDTVGVTHELEQLQLAIPFLSNLVSRREVVTEPRVAFVLNGSAFDSSASSTPFADDRRTRARIAIPTLDLAPYVPYWPQAWPVQLESGALHVDLAADFEQGDVPVVSVSGRVALSGLRVADRSLPGAARPLLAWDRLEVDIGRAEPLQQRVVLSDVKWLKPQIIVNRDGDGALALQRIASAFAAAGKPSGEPAASPSTTTAARPWRVQLERFDLEGGAVRWADAAVAPAAIAEMADLNLQATAMAWPMAEPFPFEVSARLGEAPVRLSGTATDRQARIGFSVGALPVTLAAAYLAQTLQPPLTGELQAEGEASWQAATPDQAGTMSLLARSVDLTNLRLGTERQPLARLKRLAVADAKIDLLARSVTVGQVRLESPRLALARDAQGRIDAQSWLKQAPAGTAAASVQPAAPWRVTLADLELAGGNMQWKDAVPAEPVNLSIDGLNLRVQNLQPLAERQPDMPVSLQALVAGGGTERTESGRLNIDGTLRLPAGDAGPSLRSQLRAERLPLHALEPYFADRLNMELLRADASYRGSLAMSQSEAGLALALSGDAALEDLQAHTRAPAEELLNWKSLQVRGLRVDMAPTQPLRVAVSETVLSDWFARIIIDPEGRINLQGLVKPAEKEAGSTGVASSAPAAQPPDVRVGPVSLINGRVLFSDRFIRPNYSANLSELTGALSAFSSAAGTPGQPPALADLSLKGRAEGTATLDVSGKLNPLANPLALDIKGVVRDLELPPLSPYSVKYAGHGIQRGKLSVDVAYKITPDGQLTASNQIVLNQLSFGDRVEGSTAPNLPVKLAVALLADRNGVIDINLPVSGSLSDPQFRLAPLIFRLIFNLIGKAITAPFALIASAFSGGEADASQVGFEPGRAVLSDEGRQQLDAVAQALQNRPALRLTVVGHSDLETERTGLQRARLDAQVLAEKRRALARTGAAVPPGMVVGADEYPALLREVYRRADIPKPRNLIGIAKDIPQAEMEALLLAAQPVNDDAMRELAVARGVAVKDYLAGRQLPEDRMFLGAPVTARTGDSWRPQARLQLAPR